MSPKTNKKVKIGILGTGNMGSAFARIFRQNDRNQPLNLLNRSWEKADKLSQELAGHAFHLDQLADFIKQSDYIFVGIKPKDFPNLFQQINRLKLDLGDKLWISMAVGLSLETLSQFSDQRLAWVRIMPNTPITIGQGYSAICFNEWVDQTQRQSLSDLLAATGQVISLPEEQFAISSALAGSGPAFIYQLIEAMADAGVRDGLGRQAAIEMAAQTVKGAASMVLETEMHPALLKDQVTSPAGTTIEGLAKLEALGFRSAIIEAIQATYLKARE